MIWGVLYFEKHRHGNSYWWLLINNYQCSYNAWLCKMKCHQPLMFSHGGLWLIMLSYPSTSFQKQRIFWTNEYIYIYKCVYLYLYKNIFVYIYIYLFVYIYIFNKYKYIYIDRYLFWKIFIFTFVCVNINIYIYTLICILRFIFLNIFTYLNILDHDDAQGLICFIVVILMPAAIPCDAFYIKAIALNTPKIVGV